MSDKMIDESVVNGISKFETIINSKIDSNPIKAAIFGHKYPDPDCIGSQMGVAWILNRFFNIESELFFEGEISHPQNNTMTNLLDPSLRGLDEYDPTVYNLNILVDTIPKNAGCGSFDINFDIVIDHHKNKVSNSDNLIHVKTGSCSAIVYHIMAAIHEANEKFEWLDVENEYDCRVATALIAGIITDTEHMMSEDSTEMEFNAYAKLFQYKSINDLRDIIFFKRPRSWIEMTALAARESTIDEEGFAVVGLGRIAEKQRDIIAAVADEMIKWSSVEAVVAFAVVGSDSVAGSVRSLNSSLSVSDLCRKLGGDFGNGGGKQGKGAYTYSLGGLSIDNDDDESVNDKIWDAIKCKESSRIFKILRS